MKSKSDSGFSFIELLVSVTIILIISSIAVVSFSSANKKARNDRRRADLEKVRSALELYRVDNDNYPTALGLLDDGVEPYLNEIPDDPKDSLDYYYDQTSDYTYDLCAYFEGDGYVDSCGSCGDEACNYKLENP